MVVLFIDRPCFVKCCTLSLFGIQCIGPYCWKIFLEFPIHIRLVWHLLFFISAFFNIVVDCRFFIQCDFILIWFFREQRIGQYMRRIFVVYRRKNYQPTVDLCRPVSIGPSINIASGGEKMSRKITWLIFVTPSTFQVFWGLRNFQLVKSYLSQLYDTWVPYLIP